MLATSAEVCQQGRRIKFKEDGKAPADISEYKLPRNITLLHGAFEELSQELPDESIDHIVTDPPYPYKFIELWSTLGEVASRVLRPGGFCVALSPHYHLPECIKRVGEHLSYYWLCVLEQPGTTNKVMNRDIIARFKPILVYYKPEMPKIKTLVKDVFVSPEPEKTGKNKQQWEQSLPAFKDIIEAFTEPKQLILDPFAGYGTTLLAAKETKRRCLGYEIDEDNYKNAFERLATI